VAEIHIVCVHIAVVDAFHAASSIQARLRTRRVWRSGQGRYNSSAYILFCRVYL